MNLKRCLLTVLFSMVLLGFASPAELHAKKENSIVGAWLQNMHPVGDDSAILAAQAIFNEDHTCVRNIDADLQRVLGPPLFPEGTVFSISDDYAIWKRKCNGKFKCVGTQIALIKNEDGTFSPLARVKCTIEYQLHGNHLKGRELLEFFDYLDLTLTIPAPGLPPIEFTIEGERLKFKG